MSFKSFLQNLPGRAISNVKRVSKSVLNKGKDTTAKLGRGVSKLLKGGFISKNNRRTHKRRTNKHR